MTTRHFLLRRSVLGFLPPRAALALDWEIERNFRYFLYPSDVAAQRVARDLYVAKNGGAAPSPEQLEHFMNGPAFWTMKLERRRRPLEKLADRLAVRRRRHAL